MVALAAQPILTTIGRVAVPKLADTLVRTGANKFVKQYGQKAFEAVLGTTAGLKAYKETEEYLTEYLNHIDSGGDEGSFVPKGSMPGTDRITQMDAAMAVPNVNESVRETGQGLVIGGEPKEILPPPEPFSTPIDSQTATILSTPIPEKVDTTLSTPIPEKVDTTLSTPDQSGELNKPIVYNKDDSEFKYPTKEELKSYIKEENKFWEEEIIPRENKKYPKLNIKNLPKIVEADKHFGAAAMGFQGFEESQLIYVSPQKYLDLTKRFRPVGKQGEGSKLNSDNIEQLLKDGKELANIPFLNVTKVGDSYEVTGQEAIHRAIAFKNLGYNKMPVVIQGTGTDKVAGVENKLYTATPKSYLYTEDWAKDYIGFIPKSIQSDGEVLF